MSIGSGRETQPAEKLCEIDLSVFFFGRFSGLLNIRSVSEAAFMGRGHCNHEQTQYIDGLRGHRFGAILMAFRWQIVVNASLIYRLDRLTGDVRVCIKQTPDDPHLLTCYKQGEPTRVSLKLRSRVEGLALATAPVLCCAYARHCSPASIVFDSRRIDAAGAGED
jgi:hypothetical protein